MAARHPAFRRFRGRALVSAATIVASVALASWLIPDHSPPGPEPVALALLSGAGVLIWIWAMARLLAELDDEYMRMLIVRQILVATAVTLGVSGMWGMVELMTTVPRVPVFFIFPIWAAGFWIGAMVNKLTLGDTGRSC